MAAKPKNAKNLREATEITDRVKQIASKVYGFHAYLVKPLEADGDDPSKYCMFDRHPHEGRVRGQRHPVPGERRRALHLRAGRGVTPTQSAMCRLIRGAMAEFYKCPENERRFEKWRQSRQRGGASQPASIARAPQRFTAGVNQEPC